MKKHFVTLVIFVLLSHLYAQNATNESSDKESAKQYLHFSLTSRHSYFEGDKDTKIISLGILGTQDQNIMGIQESFFFNKTENEMLGLQQTIGINKAYSFKGIQNSVIGNITKDDSLGVQFSGLFNKSSNMKGLQWTYFANIAQNIDGAQISMFYNKAANVNGLQYGLVNCASDNAKATFGLINIIKNGVHDFGCGLDTNKTLYFQIQEGGQYLYTTIGAAGKMQYQYFDGQWAKVFIGLGTRQKCKYFSFDEEFLWNFTLCDNVHKLGSDMKKAVKDEDEDKMEDIIKELKHYQSPSLRFTVNYEPLKHFSIFTSAQLDIRTHDRNDEAFIFQDHKFVHSITVDNTKITFYPAFSAGVKIR